MTSSEKDIVNAIKKALQEKGAWVYWAAGIIEGEGYIGTSPSGRCITVSMCDFDVIRKLAEIIPGGVVYEREVPGKPQLTWKLSKRNHLIAAAQVLGPLMGSRRGEAMAQLALLEPLPEPKEHGTGGYRRGCRCGECKEAKRGYQQQVREADRQ